jgi:hypothetical protein
MPVKRKKVVPLLRDKFKISWSGCPVHHNEYAKWPQKVARHHRRRGYSLVTGRQTGGKMGLAPAVATWQTASPPRGRPLTFTKRPWPRSIAPVTTGRGRVAGASGLWPARLPVLSVGTDRGRGTKAVRQFSPRGTRGAPCFADSRAVNSWLVGGAVLHYKVIQIRRQL